MNAQRLAGPEFSTHTSMKGALFKSTLFHVMIFVVAAVGLPFVKPPPLILTPTSVELVDISEVSKTNKRAMPKPKPIEKPKEPEPPKPPPEAVKEPEKVKEPDPIPPPEPEVKKEPEPKPKPKKPDPKPEEKPKEPERDINDLLKDLTPTEEQPEQSVETEEGSEISEIPDYSVQMSMSEQEALEAGISPCWNIDGGGRYAETLVVELHVTIYPDMRVKSVQPTDQLRYATDSAFRAAADAASRALRNPRCNKLQLPPQKYGNKTFKLTFDPSKMLGY